MTQRLDVAYYYPWAKMSDEIIEELWRIKDSIAREHANDIRKLAAHLQDGKRRKHSEPQGRSAADMLDESPRPTPLQDR